MGHATDVVKPVGGLYSSGEKRITGFGYRICDQFKSRPGREGEALSRHAVNPVPTRSRRFGTLPTSMWVVHGGSTRGVPPLTVLKGLPLPVPLCHPKTFYLLTVVLGRQLVDRADKGAGVFRVDFRGDAVAQVEDVA